MPIFPHKEKNGLAYLCHDLASLLLRLRRSQEFLGLPRSLCFLPANSDLAKIKHRTGKF
jgi:hypothetical protein